MKTTYAEWVARIDEQTLRSHREMNEAMRFRIQPFTEALRRLGFKFTQWYMKAGEVRFVARECCYGIGAVSVAQVDRQSGLGRLFQKGGDREAMAGVQANCLGRIADRFA